MSMTFTAKGRQTELDINLSNSNTHFVLASLGLDKIATVDPDNIIQFPAADAVARIAWNRNMVAKAQSTVDPYLEEIYGYLLDLAMFAMGEELPIEVF